MKPVFDDNQLKRLYTEQRRSDQHAAPSFGATLHAARAREETADAFPALRLAVTASLILAAGAGVSFYLHHSSTRPLQHAASSSSIVLITQWKSPTEFLLNPTYPSDDTNAASEQIQ